MDKKRKDLLVFGYGLSVLIPALVTFHARKHGLGPISYSLLGATLVVLVLTIINVELIRPFYNKWMKVAHFIGTVITSIILIVMFYLIFGVVGIILRIMKKDLLDRKIELDRDTYWIKREKTAFEQKTYQQQF